MKLQRNNATSGPSTAGRLDILAYRLLAEHLLPAMEQRSGLSSGLAEQLKPLAEAICADCFPAKSIFPKPKRRLC